MIADVSKEVLLNEINNIIKQAEELGIIKPNTRYVNGDPRSEIYLLRKEVNKATYELYETKKYWFLSVCYRYKYFLFKPKNKYAALIKKVILLLILAIILVITTLWSLF